MRRTKIKPAEHLNNNNHTIVFSLFFFVSISLTAAESNSNKFRLCLYFRQFQQVQPLFDGPIYREMISSVAKRHTIDELTK